MAFQCASWLEDKQDRSLVFEIPIHLTGGISACSLNHADADGWGNQESKEEEEVMILSMALSTFPNASFSARDHTASIAKI